MRRPEPACSLFGLASLELLPFTSVELLPFFCFTLGTEADETSGQQRKQANNSNSIRSHLGSNAWWGQVIH